MEEIAKSEPKEKVWLFEFFFWPNQGGYVERLIDSMDGICFLDDLRDETKPLPIQVLPTVYFIELSKQIETGVIQRRIGEKYAQAVSEQGT